MLKKIAISLFLLLALFVVDAQAEFPVQLGGLNLQGDTIYLFDTGEFALGVGSTIAVAYENLIELRGEVVFKDFDGIEPQHAGVGVGLNFVALIEKIGGEWNMPDIGTTVGVLGLFDIKSSQKIQTGAYLSVVKIF